MTLIQADVVEQVLSPLLRGAGLQRIQVALGVEPVRPLRCGPAMAVAREGVCALTVT